MFRDGPLAVRQRSGYSRHLPSLSRTTLPFLGGGPFLRAYPLSRLRVDGLGYRRGKSETPCALNTLAVTLPVSAFYQDSETQGRSSIHWACGSSAYLAHKGGEIKINSPSWNLSRRQVIFVE